jgi:hypothetical protein
VLALAAPTAIAKSSGNWPPPTCPTGLLVAYYVGDGSTFNNDLVIGWDRRAWLCWGRHVANSSGRKSFLLSPQTLATLETDLGRIDTQRLGSPRQQPCCDRTTATLVFEGKAIPRDGYPKSKDEVRALRQAEAILNRIIRQNSPDHLSISVAEPRRAASCSCPSRLRTNA